MAAYPLPEWWHTGIGCRVQPAPNPDPYSLLPSNRRHLGMRATVMYGAGDVRVEDVPDAQLIDPSDALVRVTRAAICGSDLWPYKSMPHDDAGRRMGHEFIGVVEAVGSDVETVKAGDVVVSPFLWSDGSCAFCREGRQTVSAWRPVRGRRCRRRPGRGGAGSAGGGDTRGP